MRAFEISLNGQKLCVAGIGDDGVLSAIVNWVVEGGKGDLFLEVGGLISPAKQHVSWVCQKRLQLQDKIQIRILETDEVDEPAQKSQSKVPASRHIGGIIGPY